MKEIAKKAKSEGELDKLVNLADIKGQYPLQSATFSGNNTKMAEFLLKNGDEINVASNTSHHKNAGAADGAIKNLKTHKASTNRWSKSV